MKRFLVTRLSAVGDCILTMPLVTALRQHVPEAEIAWLVQRGPSFLVERHPDVDHTLVVPKGWLRSPSQIAATRRLLRRYRFDCVLDPQSLTKSALAGWLSGTKRRIGFAGPQGRELAPWLSTIAIRPSAEHVVDAYLELLGPLGLPVAFAGFGFQADEESLQQVAAWRQARQLAGPLAVMNPGAGWDSKLWPHDRFADLARLLAERHGLSTVVVWAGPREEAWARDIVARSGGAAQLAPPTSLPELAGWLQQATLFVGSDTGPLHLAAAVGTPCVGLYGPTRPQQCGPYGPTHQTVQAYYQSGSSRQRRQAPNSALQAVSVQSVAEACRRALDSAVLPVKDSRLSNPESTIRSTECPRFRKTG